LAEVSPVQNGAPQFSPVPVAPGRPHRRHTVRPATAATEDIVTFRRVYL
jgi:hypothetical protein